MHDSGTWERNVQLLAHLRRFQKLCTAVRKRYQEDIDFKLYEERVRKLLDQHIHASEVITLTAPVNIFDEQAFEEAVGEQSIPASMIASLTQRTITERMEEDPVYFERISALIQEAIDDHRAQRISQLNFSISSGMRVTRWCGLVTTMCRSICARTPWLSPSTMQSKSNSHRPTQKGAKCAAMPPRLRKRCSTSLRAAGSSTGPSTRTSRTRCATISTIISSASFAMRKATT